MARSGRTSELRPLFRGVPALSLRAGLWLAAAVLAMVLDARAGWLGPLRTTLSALVYPVQYAVSVPVRGLELASELLSSRTALVADNRELRSRVLTLSERNRQLATLAEENLRLRRLLDAAARVDGRTALARVVGVQVDGGRRQAVIAKGAASGVFEGQPVVDAAGVLGQVVAVTPWSATVMLVSDPRHAVPVRLPRSGLQALAVGTGKPGGLELVYVPATADVREGDAVVCSGLGGRFPEGYPLGEVSRVDLDPREPFARVEVRPGARLRRHGEVLLLWPVREAGTPGFAHTAWSLR